MISRGIDDPVGGEHALAIVPAEARSVAAGLRRARFYAGRSVNDIAFLAEQTYRERLLALYGRTLTPGLISGLGARLGDDGLLGVDAGLAVSAQGVLVRLAAGTAVTWAELPVVGAGEGGGGAAGLLVLQPTWVEDAGDADPSDPCPRDPSADAFERWSRVDAGRLVRVPWPDAVPGGLVPAAVAEALAWEVFEAERSLAERELLPWERYGIPLALVITSASDQVLHVAPWAVARRGGGATAHGAT
ncbi:MAG TPA: hypothetical protein PKA64_10590, partial [Myxococcota bacterium]|nr:hypothetical protein [Myxococcota bacterium]